MHLGNSSDLFIIIKQIEDFVSKAAGDLPSAPALPSPEEEEPKTPLGFTARATCALVGGDPVYITEADEAPLYEGKYKRKIYTTTRGKLFYCTIPEAYVKNGEEHKLDFALKRTQLDVGTLGRGKQENVSGDIVNTISAKVSSDNKTSAKKAGKQVRLGNALDNPEIFTIDWGQTLDRLFEGKKQRDNFKAFPWPRNASKILEKFGTGYMHEQLKQFNWNPEQTKDVVEGRKKSNNGPYPDGNPARMHTHIMDEKGIKKPHLVGDKHDNKYAKEWHEDEIVDYAEKIEVSAQNDPATLEGDSELQRKIALLAKLKFYKDAIEKHQRNRNYTTVNPEFLSQRAEIMRKIDEKKDMAAKIINGVRKDFKGSSDVVDKTAKELGLEFDEKKREYKTTDKSKLKKDEHGKDFYDKKAQAAYEKFVSEQKTAPSQNEVEIPKKRKTAEAGPPVEVESPKQPADIGTVGVSGDNWMKQLDVKSGNKIQEIKPTPESHPWIPDVLWGKEVGINSYTFKDNPKREINIIRIPGKSGSYEKPERFCVCYFTPEDKEKVEDLTGGQIVNLRQSGRYKPEFEPKTFKTEQAARNEVKEIVVSHYKAKQRGSIQNQFAIEKTMILNKIENLVNSPMPSLVLPVENEINGFKVFSQFQSGANRVTLEGKDNEYKVCTNGIASLNTEDFREALAKYYSSVSRVIDTQNEDKDIGLEMFGEHVLSTARKTRKLMADLDKSYEAEMLENLDYGELEIPFNPDFILKYEYHGSMKKADPLDFFGIVPSNTNSEDVECEAEGGQKIGKKDLKENEYHEKKDDRDYQSVIEEDKADGIQPASISNSLNQFQILPTRQEENTTIKPIEKPYKVDGIAYQRNLHPAENKINEQKRGVD